MSMLGLDSRILPKCEIKLKYGENSMQSKCRTSQKHTSCKFAEGNSMYVPVCAHLRTVRKMKQLTKLF